MTTSKVPMTVTGADMLRNELNRLKTDDRRKVIEAIAEARAHGDLKENAEYHAARERQSFIEGRIKELEGKLSNLQIIDVKSITNNGKVVFGATVSFLNTSTNEKVKYQIVGEDEADIKSLKISYTSPMARAVIAKEEGDIVSVNTPRGMVEYEIVEVEYI